MRNSLRPYVAIPALMVVLVSSPEISMSQEHSKLVDTGVIFSVRQVETSRLRGFDITNFSDLASPFWMPVPDEVALLESKLKPYLESATTPAARVIATRLGSYKRQYIGYTKRGKRWIFVNGFCEEFSRKSDTWHDRLVVVIDGGLCFFTVRYDVSRSRFAHLLINNTFGGQ